MAETSGEMDYAPPNHREYLAEQTFTIAESHLMAETKAYNGPGFMKPEHARVERLRWASSMRALRFAG